MKQFSAFLSLLCGFAMVLVGGFSHQPPLVLMGAMAVYALVFAILAVAYRRDE